MKRIMVQYRVKPEHAAENERLVKAVFAALRERAPEDFRYASFKGDDGVSFTHIVSLEAADGGNPLDDIEAFDAFTGDIAGRCDVAPKVTPLTEVGSYRFFD